MRCGPPRRLKLEVGELRCLRTHWRLLHGLIQALRTQRNVSLDTVERRSPLLLLRALDYGRVLVDRDSRWQPLRERRGVIASAVSRARRADDEAVEESWRMLAEDA